MQYVQVSIARSRKLLLQHYFDREIRPIHGQVSIARSRNVLLQHSQRSNSLLLQLVSIARSRKLLLQLQIFACHCDDEQHVSIARRENPSATLTV